MYQRKLTTIEQLHATITNNLVVLNEEQLTEVIFSIRAIKAGVKTANRGLYKAVREKQRLEAENKLLKHQLGFTEL